MVSSRLLQTLSLAFAALAVHAAVIDKRAPPKLKLGAATLTGAYGLGGAEAFRGIPYGQPPVGNLRFMPPLKAAPLTGEYDAARNPKACRQNPSQLFGGGSGAVIDLFNSLFINSPFAEVVEFAGRLLGLTNIKVIDADEDCLYLNVVRPAGTSTGDALPIFVWLFGGANYFGDVSLYDPGFVIQRSIDMKQPVIHVAMNYRLGIYGFSPLGGGNVGLRDQRLAFEWVRDHAAEFGGDPKKVTLWGESAGAFDIGMHLISEGTTSTDLYRAVIQESGSSYHIRRIEDPHKGMTTVNRITGCGNAAEGVLKCLQGKTVRQIEEATAQIPGLFSWAVAFPWEPLVDGTFIPDYPEKLLREGKFKRNVAIMNGANDDEGTLLTLGAIANMTSESAFLKWNKDFFGISDLDYQQLAQLYPADPAAGSPYNTGSANSINSQNKRVASLYGDTIFQMPRKVALREMVKYSTAKVYSYNFKGYKYIPLLGSFHLSEIFSTYGTAVGSRLTNDMLPRWIAFANTLTPDVPSLAPKWPTYGKERRLFVFNEAETVVGIDDQRDAQHAFLEKLVNV